MLFIHQDIWIGKSLDIYGEWADGELELLKSLIKPGNTVLDIGANVGTHALAFSQFVGKNGIVHSFEPIRLLYYILCSNVAMNNIENVFCHQAVVSHQAGEMVVPEIDTENNSFGGTVLHNYAHRNVVTPLKEGKQKVPVVRIDDLNLAECHLIKADVEGMEADVLKGALKTIERCRPYLYLESDPHWFNVQECHDLVQSLGYSIQKHEPEHFKKDNFNNYPTDVFGGNISRNILCTPK